jgi:hypothetical protein
MLSIPEPTVLSIPEPAGPVVLSIPEAPPAPAVSLSIPEPSPPPAPVVSLSIPETPVSLTIPVPTPEPAAPELEPLDQLIEGLTKPEVSADRPATVPLFQDLLRQNPDVPEALDWAWDLTQGQESEYLNIFRDLTKTEMDEPRHVRNFARAYLRLGRPLLAVVQFQKYLNSSPSSVGYRELAAVYLKLNRERNVNEATQKADDLAAKGL